MWGWSDCRRRTKTHVCQIVELAESGVRRWLEQAGIGLLGAKKAPDQGLAALTRRAGGEGEIRTPDQGLMSASVIMAGDSMVFARPAPRPVRSSSRTPCSQSPDHV